MENMLKYDFMKYRHRLLFVELHQFTSGTPYIPQKKKTKLTNLIIVP